MSGHPQVRITDGEQAADVDLDMASIILALWQRGIRTVGSCQGDPDINPAWIGFPTLTEAERVQHVIGRIACLMIPDEEDFATASPASFEAGYSQRGLSAVAFAPKDIPAVLARITRLKRPNYT